MVDLKNAFYLLIEANELKYQEIESMLEPDEKHLLKQLLSHTTILTGFTYSLTNEEEEYGE